MRYQSSLLPLCAAVFSFVVAAWPAASAHAAENEVALAPTEILDVDGNGNVGALTDGLMVLRYIFGLRGQALIQGAIGPDATRTTAAQIESYLATLVSSLPNPANCSIAAAPTSSVATPLPPGTSVQLTANCGKGVTPVTFAWSIGVINPSITVSPSSTATYTVTPANVAGPGIDISTTVHIGLIPAPASCSISQSPNAPPASPVPAGTNVTLSMDCAGGGAPTSCAWSNGIASTSCVVSAAPSTTTTYSATASNATGSSPSVSTTIYIGNAGPVSQNFCTGNDAIITVPWPASGQMSLFTNGFKDQALAYKIVVPFTFSRPLDISHSGFMRISEKAGFTITAREFTISKHSCDFQSGNYVYPGVPGDTSPYVSYTVNNPNGLGGGATININSGDTIYFNVRNRVEGRSSCPYASCEILWDFSTPDRY